MSTQYQLRRGTTAECLLFTGAQGEIVVDTDKHTLVVQDGITPGGYPQATQNQVSNGTFYYNEDAGSAANSYILVPKANTNTPTSYQDGIQFGFVTTHPNSGPSTANFQGLGVKNLKYPGGVDPQAGDISGRVYLIYDATNGWLEIQRKASGAPPQLRSITASVGSSNMTITLQPGLFEFRSTSLGSGAVTTITSAAPVSITVPSGATLGTQSGVANRLAVLAVNNAGTIQLAVVNLVNGILLEETGLIDVVAITAGASSASVIYSTSAVTGVAYRVVGFVQSTQATAGAWLTAPSQVQGQGGQALIGLSKITSASLQAATSGTSLDFTGIPSFVRRITMMLNLVSTNGTSSLLVQIGPVSGVETTTYSGGYSNLRTGAFPVTAAATNGLQLATDPDDAASTRVGIVTATKLDGNTWILSGNIVRSNNGAASIASASKTLAGTLDRIRLTTVSGTDSFDAGSVNIIYEG